MYRKSITIPINHNEQGVLNNISENMFKPTGVTAEITTSAPLETIKTQEYIPVQPPVEIQPHTQYEPPKQQKNWDIDATLFELINSPVLWEVYRQFFVEVSQHQGYGGSIWWYFRHIDETILLSSLEGFGVYDDSRVDEYKRMILRVIKDSEKVEPERYNKKQSWVHIFNIIKKHKLEPIESSVSHTTTNQPQKPSYSTNTLLLMYWTAEQFVYHTFLTQLQVCASALQEKSNSLHQTTAVYTASYIHFVAHQSLYPFFARYYAETIYNIQATKNKETSGYQHKTHKISMVKQLDALAKSITMTQKPPPSILTPCIYFNKDVYMKHSNN